MSNSMNSTKIFAVAATILFFAMLVWGGMEYSTNKKLETGLNNEKLKSEKLLSEKLSVNKEIEKVKADLNSYKGKNKELDKFLAEANQKISARENEIKKLGNDKNALKMLQKQQAELKLIKEQLDNQVNVLNASLTSLKNENQDLNSSVASLQTKNKSLTDEISRMKLASMDKIQVDALTKKGQKLTVTARKTRQILVTFEIPASIQNNLSYKIRNPSGVMLNEKQGTIKTAYIENHAYIASSERNVSEPLAKKTIRMTYETKEKLQSGTYLIEVSGEDQLYIGTLQVKLR